MEIANTSIEGCYILKPRVFEDDRGKLVKVYHENTFKDHGLITDFKEEYFSVSQKDVLRGLHFQLPPFDHVKCVPCLEGRIFDVVVDLRKDSSTYKKHFGIELSAENGYVLYIPSGMAHGFCTLSESSIFLNRTSTVYNAENEAGILWSSCNIDWPIHKPLLSEKDKNLIELNNFISPF